MWPGVVYVIEVVDTVDVVYVNVDVRVYVVVELKVMVNVAVMAVDVSMLPG